MCNLMIQWLQKGIKGQVDIWPLKIGYNINVLLQTACLVVNPITVGNFALTAFRLFDGSDLKTFLLIRW